MRGVVLVCGETPLSDVPRVLDVQRVPSRPGKADVDEVLRELGSGDGVSPAHGEAERPRVVVAGSDADLAAVVLRMLRRELLGALAVGFVPAGDSAGAALWGIPSGSVNALQLAVNGTPRAVPVVRDDAGGVLVGLGVLNEVDGVAYCDDDLALRGKARRIEVRPHADGVDVRVTRGRLRRATSRLHGRAFQYGGQRPVLPVLDGVPRERPIQRWTWYRHTADLLLVRE